jgi:hypothetical protein
MKIFSKSYLIKEQIEARVDLAKNGNVDGIELVLRNTNLDDISNVIDLLRFCSDNFGTVSLETGDRLCDETPITSIVPTDLLDEKGQEYVENVLSLLTNNNVIQNPGVLVVHLAGGCRNNLYSPPFDETLALALQRDKENLSECLEYINNIDPENKLIALENTFPTD